MIRIGITGATGFLGSYVTQYLMARGEYRLRAISRNLQSDIVSRLPTVEWLQGDLTSEKDCEEFVRSEISVRGSHKDAT